MYMDVIDVVYRLKRAGYSQVRLARELGVTRAVVNDVIHGRGPSLRVAARIATVIGEDIEFIWPGRYSRHQAPAQLSTQAEKGE